MRDTKRTRKLRIVGWHGRIVGKSLEDDDDARPVVGFAVAMDEDGERVWSLYRARYRQSVVGRYLAARSRCLHPGQQQGLRWPSSSSSCVRRMRRSRVVCCLASSTQQMNSLRAKGVMSFQASSAVVLATNASRRSAGSGCTTPPGIGWLLTRQR